jgi:hypothetical protein
MVAAADAGASCRLHMQLRKKKEMKETTRRLRAAVFIFVFQPRLFSFVSRSISAIVGQENAGAQHLDGAV